MNTHHRRSWIVIALIVGSAFVFAGEAQPPVAFAQDGQVKVTVKVTDSGFEPSVVEVEQGKSVALTFVFAHVAYPQEEHIIVIPGYKIETAKIDAAHRETTVTFIAAQTGSFSFQCDLECETHDSLQTGQIKVTPSRGGATVALLPSKLVVDPVNGVLIRGGTVTIAARLQGDDGEPIPRGEVRFYAKQEFLGEAGLVEIGVAKTLPNGYASVLFHPTTRDARTIVAKFSGVGTYAATEQEIALIGNDQFVPRGIPSTDDGLHGLKGAAYVALVLMIASIWLAFGFMGLQALGIRRAAGGGEKA